MRFVFFIQERRKAKIGKQKCSRSVYRSIWFFLWPLYGTGRFTFLYLVFISFFVSYVSKWMRKCVSVSKHDIFLLLTYRSSYGVVQFDYFKLVFQWSRTFCELREARICIVFTKLMKMKIKKLKSVKILTETVLNVLNVLVFYT